jgi:hypothetical protein
MSGVLLRAPSGQIAVIAATEKTVIQIIAATQHRVKVNRIAVTFEGATSTDAPAQVRIAKQTTAIGTEAAVTVVKVGDFGETIQTTAKKYGNSEPTTTDVYDQDLVPVYQGGRIFLGPYWIPGGGRLGVLVTSPVNVDCAVTVDMEE